MWFFCRSAPTSPSPLTLANAMVHEDMSSDGGALSDAMMYQIVETSAAGDNIGLTSSHPQIFRTVPHLKTQHLRFPQSNPGTPSSKHAIFFTNSSTYLHLNLLKCLTLSSCKSFITNIFVERNTKSIRASCKRRPCDRCRPWRVGATDGFRNQWKTKANRGTGLNRSKSVLQKV